MTREEAIKWFRENPFYHEKHVPFNMAIKALEQLPKLQNRCYALTQGQICFFCPYECERRAEIEPQESEDKE